MNKMYVLKDVAFGTKVGGGIVADINEVDELAPGATAFFNEKGVYLTAILLATPATLADQKTVTMAVGRNDGGTQIFTVPRKDVDVNRGNFRAFTRPTINVGGVTAQLNLPITGTGDVSIKINDTTHTSAFNIRTKNVSVYKTAAMSAENVVDELVTRINKITWLSAVKLNATTNYGIAITPTQDQVTISVHASEMIADADISIATDFVYGQGVGTDVLQMEKDFSTEEGNSNPIDWNAEYYPRVMEVNPNGNYDLVSLKWVGQHQTPTTFKNVMNNNLVFSSVNGATNQSATLVVALLALIFGTAYTADAGAETATDSGTQHDGIAGN